ncbi:MAG: hypothetical protein ACR2IS_16500 [Nitrososphaeraceae archaeon]
MVKVLPHVMRNINEFNIPAGDTHGYEILYFGVNLILMFDYRLSFDIKVIKNSDQGSNNIEALIISRKDVSAWKKGNDSGNKDMRLYFSNSGESINDIFKPSVSDAFAFILNNKATPVNNSSMAKTVEVTLIHTWQQEIKESQLRNM